MDEAAGMGDSLLVQNLHIGTGTNGLAISCAAYLHQSNAKQCTLLVLWTASLVGS